jgi:hypothetical protein
MAETSAEKLAGTTNTFTWVLNIETMRMIAYINLVFLILVGTVITNLYVEVPPEETVIFEIFGFNHICNVLDHQPSRWICALLVVFFILPMAAFVLFSYFRTYDAAKRGRVPLYLQAYNKAITPFVFLSVCYTYMWFVNTPITREAFLGHYLPYVALQLAFGLLAIQEVSFLIHNDVLPFGFNATWAKAYLVLLLATTAIAQLAVFSLLLGYPILDSKNNETDRAIFQFVMYLYSFLAIIMPIIMAARNRKNGKDSIITFSSPDPA